MRTVLPSNWQDVPMRELARLNIFAEGEEDLTSIALAIVHEAIKTSKAIRSGMFHPDRERQLDADDVESMYLEEWEDSGDITIDYLYGRAVKLHLKRQDDHIAMHIGLWSQRWDAYGKSGSKADQALIDSLNNLCGSVKDQISRNT